MARMYSGKKGKSGSKKPVKSTVPSWVTYKPKEVEMLIAKFVKEGKSASMTGLILRDTYGIPDVKTLCGKSISKIIAEKKLNPELPDDLFAMIKTLAAAKKHVDNNKKDEVAKRGLHLANSKIKSLIKYYKRSGRLAEGWKLDMTRIGYYLE